MRLIFWSVLCLIMFSALPGSARESRQTWGLGVCGTSFTTNRCLRFECIVTMEKGVTVNLAVCHVAQGAGHVLRMDA